MPCIERLAAAPVRAFRFSHDAGNDRGHHLAAGASLRRSASPVGEQQVPGPDQGGSERVYVGIGRDAAQVAVCDEIGADHGGGFRRQRDACRPGPAQPGATIATATDPNRALARLSPYIRKHINEQLGIADPSCVKRAAGGEDA